MKKKIVFMFMLVVMASSGCSKQDVISNIDTVKEQIVQHEGKDSEKDYDIWSKVTLKNGIEITKYMSFDDFVSQAGNEYVGVSLLGGLLTLDSYGDGYIVKTSPNADGEPIESLFENTD